MKIKNKNFEKYKNKKFIFFRPKLEQEIKNRKNPQKTGKIRKSKKILTKNLSFLIDFSLTPAGVPFPLEQSLILLNKSHSQALCSKCLSVRPRG